MNKKELTEKINKEQLQDDQRLLIWWLGQSGFLVKSRSLTFVIDPYLSTTLEDITKDMGPDMKHVRMMPVPVEPEKLSGIDYIFCTHDHGDHYDRASVKALKQGNRNAKLIVPPALKPSLIRDGFLQQDIIAVGTEEMFKTDYLTVTAVAGKHNEFDYSEIYGYPYVGFIIRMDDICIYHSGDTVLYDKLPDLLKNQHIDIGFMAINGYDDVRIKAGFQSNFTYQEAAGLAEYAGVCLMIPCHYNMFTVNTEQIEKYVNYMNESDHMPKYMLPVIGEALIIRREEK